MRYTLCSLTAVLCLAPSAALAQVYGDPASLVNSWYGTFLGRPADANAAPWINGLSRGDPADQVLAGIIASPEYYQRAGNTPQGFVNQLFVDVLKRPPNGRELDFWVRRFYVQDRQAVANGFLDQYPGVWVGSTPQPAPVVVTPSAPPQVLWERDRRPDWDRHHDIHEYRRPDRRDDRDRREQDRRDDRDRRERDRHDDRDRR